VWGSTDLTSGTGSGYAVVVRYGHFYVLYGHLREVDPNLYTGAAVNRQTRLGAIGVFNESHLHIEVRTFGSAAASSIVALEADTTDPANPLSYNQYGILKVILPEGDPRNYHARNLYDIAQLFAASGVSTPDGVLVSELGQDLVNEDSVVAGDCSLTYRTLSALPTVSNVRGFILFDANFVAPADPATSPVGF
jgi:hypothetical protein